MKQWVLVSKLYLERKIWEILLSEMQEYEALFEFKSEVISWNPTNCPCKLCKTYIGGVGYVWMVGQYTPRDKSYESIRNVGLFNIKENLQSKFFKCSNFTRIFLFGFSRDGL